MKCLRRTLFTLALLTLVAVSVTPLLAQNPRNPGIYKDYSAPISSSLRFLASDAGKNALLHSPNPAALTLLRKFHPDAVGQYPLTPLMHPGPSGGRVFPATVTGCGTASGTVMNLEPAAGAVAQHGNSVDFLLSELGSGKDLVVEHGADFRGYLGQFDSFNALYVHRDPSQTCYGGTDFEMGNPAIADPYHSGNMMTGLGQARVIADHNSAHKQFIFADLRFNDVTSGVGLRRIPASNFESTSTCPAGTLNSGQAATCAGTAAIIANASEDNDTDAPAIAQDQRTSGTGAGDIYVVNTSLRELRTVMLLTACKATFTTSADCSTPIIVSGSDTETSFASIAVLPGPPNSGVVTISYMNEGEIKFVSCTPQGAPVHPNCSHVSTVYSDPNLYNSLTNNPSLEFETMPVIAARTDAAGQTIFVVWSDCKSAPEFPLEACPDADIVMAVDNSISNPAWVFHHVQAGAGHQALPSIAYDTGQNVITIAYYNTGTGLYKNNTVMSMNQIPSGSITAGSTVNLTTAFDSTTGDGTLFGFGGQFGEYMGVAARGGTAAGSSRAYIAFTNNARVGSYGTATNTQADNNISRATY